MVLLSLLLGLVDKAIENILLLSPDYCNLLFGRQELFMNTIYRQAIKQAQPLEGRGKLLRYPTLISSYQHARHKFAKLGFIII